MDTRGETVSLSPGYRMSAADYNSQISPFPRFTIVVPSLNQGRYLDAALRSLEAQDYDALDVVVMDGGSTDSSQGIIEAHAARLARWRIAPDASQSAAINEGIAGSRGDIVSWLNADDLLLQGALWRVAHAWARHPGHGILLGNGFRQIEPSGERIPFCRRHLALNRRALALGLDYVLQPATFFSRAAWEEARGVREDLRYGMDWDLVLRVASRHSAVIVNEFLAVSREHEGTKTRMGGFERVAELMEIGRLHSGLELTPGGAHYALESLIEAAQAPELSEIRRAAVGAFAATHRALVRVAQNADGFPLHGDAGDVVDLPWPNRDWPEPAVEAGDAVPRISLVVPSFNQAAYLPQALESVFAQGYPQLDVHVIDGGSSDGSAEILSRYETRLATLVIEKDRGPAHAINKGFAVARGEILGWLATDDVLAHGALSEVARAFQEDPALDLVYGNAIYIDETGAPALADHGRFQTALYFGHAQPPSRVHRYWDYVHAVPQPTVFFRRRLLEACGPLDERLQYIFDFELFARMTARGRARKIERTLAFYRLHRAGRTAGWNRFLVELFEHSRARWPRMGSADFVETWLSYARAFARRGAPESARSARGILRGGAAAALSLVGLNPERWLSR